MARHATLLSVVGCFFIAGDLTAAPNYEQLVREAYKSPQSYDGEAVDRLVALGPDAVPAIGYALGRGVDFPMVLVVALGRIGSEQGMGALLTFLDSRSPFVESDALTIVSILALKGVNNPGACQPLSVILDDIVVDPHTRLAAARSLSKLCASEHAQDFILNAYDAMIDHQIQRESLYFHEEVLLGLIDVNNTRSQRRLIEVLRHEGSVRIYVPIIEHLATRRGNAVESIFLEVLDKKRMHEYPIRVAAAQGLSEMRMTSALVLESIVVALQQEGERDQWPEFIVGKLDALVPNPVLE
ncbi:MAG: hypothetical protein AAGH76_06390 [Pseudomonadota bacterium]